MNAVEMKANPSPAPPHRSNRAEGGREVSDWLEHEAKAECLDLRQLRDENEHTIDALRAENAALREALRLCLPWVVAINNKQSVERNETLRSARAALDATEPKT